MIAGADQVFVSVVSIWEAGIKWRAGKLSVAPVRFWKANLGARFKRAQNYQNNKDSIQ